MATGDAASLEQGHISAMTRKDQPVSDPVGSSLAAFEHAPWFFKTFVLGPHADGYQPLDGHYNFLFDSCYEAVGERYAWSRPGLATRPSASEIGPGA